MLGLSITSLGFFLLVPCCAQHCLDSERETRTCEISASKFRLLGTVQQPGFLKQQLTGMSFSEPPEVTAF